MAKAVKLFCQWTVDHNGKRYTAGATIELDPEADAALIASGAVGEKAPAKPDDLHHPADPVETEKDAK